VPRDQPGAVIHDADVVAARAVRMIREREVETIDGQRLAIHADTICLHGDTPGAAAIAARIRGALETAGVVVMPIAQALGRSGT
jgi:UPF0271 protein